MSIEIKVPSLPESVADATVAKWYKQEGDSIGRDENLLDLETDKVMLEVPSPKAGVIEKIIAPEGGVVKAGELLAVIKEGAVAAKPAASEAPKAEAPVAESVASTTGGAAGPAARREAAEKGVDIAAVAGSGKGGRVTKQDVAGAVGNTIVSPVTAAGPRDEKRVPMSRLRARIAERLVQSKNEAAILTTFNEINMKPVMDMRKRYKDKFEKMHGTRLGFMSFFVKAAVEALKRFPEVNASIDGNDIIYHNYYDVGIAVGTDRGLVVPILRNTENMSMADIEKQIRVYAEKAQSGKIDIEDMTGGTFTITNGGTYGSMMSTPIINPPQTGILGMHNIVERPVVENGEVVVRPIMYVALSYDHRVIDGSVSVRFLVTIKEMIEDPARLLLEV